MITKACLLKLSCSQAADYDHRIMSRVKGFSAPAQLLALVKESAGIVCPVRRDLCRRLLQADAKDLHLTVLKLRTVFYKEVQDCAASGTLAMPLYGLLRSVASAWRPDSQDIESINSMIKFERKRSPHISLSLLDARVGNRRHLGFGSNALCKHQRKWSLAKDACEAVLQEALQYYNLHSTVFVSQRFVTAEPIVDTKTAPRYYICGGPAPLEQSFQWSAGYNLLVARAARKN